LANTSQMFSHLLLSYLLFISLTLSTPIMMHSDHYGMTISTVDPQTGNVTYFDSFPTTDYNLAVGMSSNPDGSELLFSTFGQTFRVYKEPGKTSWTRTRVIQRGFFIAFWVKESTYLVGDVGAIEMLNAITGDIQFVIGKGPNETTGEFYYDRDSQLIWIPFANKGDTEKLSLRTYHFDGMKAATLIREVVVKTSIEDFVIFPFLNPTDQSVIGCVVTNWTSITTCNVNPVSGELNYLNKIPLPISFMLIRVDPSEPHKLVSFYEGHDPNYDWTYVYMVTFDRQTMKLLSNVKVKFNYLISIYTYGNAGFGFVNRG